MSGLELNKIAASVLVAGIIALVAGNVADILYKPNLNPEKKGFLVKVTDAPAASSDQAPKAPEKFDVAALLATASLDRAKDLLKKCQMCHTFDEGGHSRVGPNLWNIVLDKKAREADYTYSKAMQARASETWTYDDLFHWIRKPSEFIPGTKMTFSGFDDPQKVADIILFLRSLSNNPAPLPAK